MIEQQNIRVLIADDSKLTIVGLKTTFKQFEGVEIIGEAENGKYALDMTERLKPDIILMDIGMPVMDGIQATKAINKLNLTTKIIMLTSHDSDQDVLEALSSGASSYCMKDIEPHILVSVIKDTNEGASWLDPRIARVVLGQLANRQNKVSAQGEATLTEREIEVLSLIAKGYSNNEIAQTLCISLNTVKTHIKNIFQKLEVEDRTQAAMKAMKNELI